MAVLWAWLLFCLALAFLLGWLIRTILASRKLDELRETMDAMHSEIVARDAQVLTLGGRSKGSDEKAQQLTQEIETARGVARERESELHQMRLRHQKEQSTANAGTAAAERRAADLAQMIGYRESFQRGQTWRSTLRGAELARRAALLTEDRDRIAAALAGRDTHLALASELLANKDRTIEKLRGTLGHVLEMSSDQDAREREVAELRQRLVGRDEEIGRLNRFVTALEPLSSQLAEAERALTNAVQAKNDEIARLSNQWKQLEEALRLRPQEAGQESSEEAASALAEKDRQIAALVAQFAEAEKALQRSLSSSQAEAHKLTLVVKEIEGSRHPVAPATQATDPESAQRDIHALLASRRIEFNEGRADLHPASSDVLDSVAAILNQHPDLPVEITGHTDSVGEFWSNYELSRWRARAVKEYLVDRGIGQAQLSCHGCGSTRPIGDNATPDGRRGNNRIELRVCTELIAARGIARSQLKMAAGA
ncbi:MAG: hypothetical protein FJW39_26925 [Acidobacteria bacterium]|nr:hypothetical protein [Acidobacteriota bacterium]